MTSLQSALLTWFDVHRRCLPWRAGPGETPDPYRVWLSEIMLQQTTVATVVPYFEAFTGRWPRVEALAGADLDAVLHAWQGLGYYARARNLHKCARLVAGDLGGVFPDTEAELRKLPGVGAYTAAAIAAIAFDRPAAAVDGNVVRVLSRLQTLDSRAAVERAAPALVPPARPGDFAQALMDLGATVCTPRNPDCGACPWNGVCRARESGTPEAWPVKAPKKVRPTRYGVAFWLQRPADGAIWLRRRAEKGLLGGMMEVPSTDWRPTSWSAAEAVGAAPAVARWTPLPGRVSHTFTHFHLELTVLAGTLEGAGPNEGIWCAPEGFGGHALPTVMKKVVRHARGAAEAATRRR